MKAYLGSQDIKDKYVSRMKAHIDADELIREVGYNEEGRGCAIGCTLNDYDHGKFEDEIGPEWIAHVVDDLFEGVTEGTQQKFALDVLESINPGSDLDNIKAPFLIFVLERAVDNFDHDKHPKVFKCVNNVIELYKSGEKDLNKFSGLEVEATREAMEARAERSASGASRASGASGASRAAARAARAAAAPTYAANSAGAAAVASAGAAREAGSAAEEVAYDSFAVKLLELIKNCKEI